MAQVVIRNLNKLYGDVVHAEERNPVGLGFLGRRKPDELAGQPAPNLDDPEQPMTRVPRRRAASAGEVVRRAQNASTAPESAAETAAS